MNAILFMNAIAGSHGTVKLLTWFETTLNLIEEANEKMITRSHILPS